MNQSDDRVPLQGTNRANGGPGSAVRGIPVIRSSQFPETRVSLLDTLSNGPLGQAAWREFFERYTPAIYRVSRMRGLTHEDADDIVQQTMISISSHIGDFEYNRDRGKFRNWVQTIAENKIKALWRKRSMPNAKSDAIRNKPDEGPSIDDLWTQEWRIQDLLWCLDQVAKDVSPRKMEAFNKYALNGMPAKQVAEEMNMTTGNVYVTRHVILNRIREKATQLDRELDIERSIIGMFNQKTEQNLDEPKSET
jgi:RNA polymerase sigma-70 factor, ECF subfamily